MNFVRIPFIIISIFSFAFFILPEKASAESYVEMLRAARSTDQIIEAMYQLSYYGNSTCFWDFVKYLNYTSAEDEGSRAPQIRKAAAEALGRTKDERAVKYLVERYAKEKKDEVKSSIIFGLSFHGAPEILPVIQDGLASKDENVKHQALMAAVRYGKNDTVASIKGIFANEKDASMKMTASYALYMLNDDKDGNKKYLTAGLKSEDPVLRFRSADYIGRAGIEESGGEIIKAMEIENKWWVRTEMDRALNLLYEVRKQKRIGEEAEAYKFLDKTSPPTESKKDAGTGANVPAVK